MHRRYHTPVALGCFVLDRIPDREYFSRNAIVPVASSQVLCVSTCSVLSTWVVALQRQIATEMGVAVPQPQAVSRKTAIWPYLRPVYGFGKVPDGYPSDTREVCGLLLFDVLFPAKQEQNRALAKCVSGGEAKGRAGAEGPSQSSSVRIFRYNVARKEYCFL
jgi:hypothetical protein